MTKATGMMRSDGLSDEDDQFKHDLYHGLLIGLKVTKNSKPWTIDPSAEVAELSTKENRPEDGISLLFFSLLSLLYFKGKALYLKVGCCLTEVVALLELVTSQFLLALDVGICFLEVCLQCALLAFCLSTVRSQITTKPGIEHLFWVSRVSHSMSSPVMLLLLRC